MNLEPEGVKLLILPEKVAEKTDGGIWRPDTAKDKEQIAVTKGTVVAIGPQVESRFETGPIEEGDVIIFAKYGGAIVSDGETEYRIINDDDVLVRMKKE